MFGGAAAVTSVALLAVGLCTYGIACGNRDPRPRGTLEDVLALRERSDLNVLFILVDTLRADRLGAYGYARDTSPNLDALAASGIRFARQVSQSSWTKCSMASLWTGLYPARTRVLRSHDVLSPGARVPAEIFQEAGFRTAAVWRNSWIAPNFGFSQGFEIYHNPPPRQGARARVDRAENPNLTLAGTDADTIDSAREFLRVHGQERWFLYLHMMDVHQYVYSEETALFGTNYSDSYDNSIRWVDNLLGYLFTELAQRDLLARTLIVFSSDHGEAFGEHDGEGHARNVYGEVTTTPLIIAPPFRLEPAITVEARSENVDLWPTVLELVGLPPLVDADGQSLVPQIVAAAQGESAPDTDGTAFAQLDQTWGRTGMKPAPMVAVNQGRWRLIYRALTPRRSELYDTWEDPLEQRNLAGEQPAVLEELNERARAYLQSDPPPWGEQTPTVEIDELQLNQLRALGYGVR
ncbi:MAG TPA: sulfatase [Myxococcota bacterium]